MLAIYNGKEYVCRKSDRQRPDGTWTRCILNLRSFTKDDEGFVQCAGGWYTKKVYGDECTGIRYANVFADYNDETVPVLYVRGDEICVYASSQHGYSEEFIEVILKGQVGRDIYSWCKPEVFTGFHYVVEDFVENGNPRNINKRIVPACAEEVMNYLLLTDCEMK